MQISNAQAGQQLQSAQKMQTQGARFEGSKSEEANEGSTERAAEAQKNAIAQSTGVGLHIDKKM
jgi:hypothetical protein